MLLKLIQNNQNNNSAMVPELSLEVPRGNILLGVPGDSTVAGKEGASLVCSKLGSIPPLHMLFPDLPGLMAEHRALNTAGCDTTPPSLPKKIYILNEFIIFFQGKNFERNQQLKKINNHYTIIIFIKLELVFCDYLAVLKGLLLTDSEDLTLGGWGMGINARSATYKASTYPTSFNIALVPSFFGHI